MTGLLVWLQHHWVVAVLIIFLLIVLTTYWPGRQLQMERHGRIPLEDDR